MFRDYETDEPIKFEECPIINVPIDWWEVLCLIFIIPAIIAIDITESIFEWLKEKAKE